jgi:hypothetical protein
MPIEASANASSARTIGVAAGIDDIGADDAVAVLFAAFGSVVVVVTLAVFAIGVGFTVVGAKTRLNVADAAAGSEAIEQEIVPVPPAAGVVHVNVGPDVCDSLTNVVPAGTASVMLTVAASLGPLFVTVTVNAIFVLSGAVAAAFVTPTSADPVTVVDAVELLFVELKSAVAVLIDAVFITVVPTAPALIVRTSVNVALAPFANVAALQLIVPVPPTAGVEHEKPAGVLMELKRVFGGVASETTTDVAAFGPLFDATIV